MLDSYCVICLHFPIKRNSPYACALDLYLLAKLLAVGSAVGVFRLFRPQHNKVLRLYYHMCAHALLWKPSALIICSCYFLPVLRAAYVACRYVVNASISLYYISAGHSYLNGRLRPLEQSDSCKVLCHDLFETILQLNAATYPVVIEN